jgi:hypothetical protein
VERAIGLAFNRPPKADEVERGVRFLDDFSRMKRSADVTGSEPLERFCLMLLNLNEFLFVD